MIKTGESGQITIPKTVRDTLGIRRGTKLVINVKGDIIHIRKKSVDAWSKKEPVLPEDFNETLTRYRETCKKHYDG